MTSVSMLLFCLLLFPTTQHVLEIPFFFFCLEKLRSIFQNILCKHLLNFQDLQLFQCPENRQFVKRTTTSTNQTKTIEGLEVLDIQGKYFGHLYSESPDIIRNLEVILPWKNGACRSITHSAFCCVLYLLILILELFAIPYTIIEQEIVL